MNVINTMGVFYYYYDIFDFSSKRLKMQAMLRSHTQNYQILEISL